MLSQVLGPFFVGGGGGGPVDWFMKADEGFVRGLIRVGSRVSAPSMKVSIVQRLESRSGPLPKRLRLFSPKESPGHMEIRRRRIFRSSKNDGLLDFGIYASH